MRLFGGAQESFSTASSSPAHQPVCGLPCAHRRDRSGTIQLARGGKLWTQRRHRDEAVIEKLSHTRQLSPTEAQAVEDLYFRPRVDLAPFAFLFPDFAAADRHLIQQPDEHERWAYFRRHFALAHARCRTIAEHLGAHVAQVTLRKHEQRDEVLARSWCVLKHLHADGNRPVGGASWENDAGTVPKVTWAPSPAGGAFAALLGLTGTGLVGELTLADHSVAWREVLGPLVAFGQDRNRANCPVPTILPNLELTLPPDQIESAVVPAGFAIDDRDGTSLGGAQGFHGRWAGALLIEEDGTYRFRAGLLTAAARSPEPRRDART